MVERPLHRRFDVVLSLQPLDTGDPLDMNWLLDGPLSDDHAKSLAVLPVCLGHPLPLLLHLKLPVLDQLVRQLNYLFDSLHFVELDVTRRIVDRLSRSFLLFHKFLECFNFTLLTLHFELLSSFNIRFSTLVICVQVHRGASW